MFIYCRLSLPLKGLKEDAFDKAEFFHSRGYDQLESTIPVILTKIMKYFKKKRVSLIVA
jgi:hypothetical protein